MNKELIYYAYYLLDDLQFTPAIWRELTGQTLTASSNRLNLSNNLPDLIERISLDHEEYAIYYYNHFLILEVVLRATGSHQQTLAELQARIIDPLTTLDPWRTKIGETVLLLAEDWRGAAELAHREEIEVESRFGRFRFVRTALDGERHFYSINLNQLTEKGLDGLRTLLPLMDMRIFIHNSKMHYIQDRNALIDKEADTIGQGVSEILQDRFDDQRNQPLTEILELEIDQLARNYGILASHYRLLRESQGILTRSLTRVTGEARRIFDFQVKSSLQDYLALTQKFNSQVQQTSERVNLIMAEIKAAIDVIQTQVDLLRSKEAVELQRQMTKIMDQNILLQEKSLTLQVAAGFVEFIVVAYYSFSLWKNQSNPEYFSQIPGIVTLLVASAFAGVSVFVTHELAQEQRLTKHLGQGLAGLLLLFALMVLLSSGLIF